MVMHRLITQQAKDLGGFKLNLLEYDSLCKKMGLMGNN